MTSDVRFNRELNDWLDEQAGHRAPAYLEEVLARTSHTPQRAAWSSLEWWLPLESIRLLRAAPLGQLAWLMLVALAILALLGVVVGGAALRRSPPPFGLAGNGLIAIANQDAIVIANPDGSAMRQLVEARDGVESLAWSPDGRRLAYRTIGPESRLTTVVVVGTDGSGPVDVAPSMAVGGFDESISWSPDSQRLVFPGGAGREPRLFVANADGSGASALHLSGTVPRRAFSAAWSPGGRWIAFTGEIEGSPDIGLHLIHPDGSEEHLLAPANREPKLGAPSWAPDPARLRLLYVLADSGIALFDVGTEREVRLEPSEGYWPTWSPDGAQVAWWSDGILVGDVEALAVGGNARRLTSVPGNCDDHRELAGEAPCGPPIWSPDGTRIFAPDVATTSVVAISVDGSEPSIAIPLKRGTALNPIGSVSWQRAAP